MSGQAVSLAVQGLRAGYGPTVILEGIDLELVRGESLSILGRNGVGKTTLLRTLMGMTTLHQGCIRLEGQEIQAIPVHRRSALGLGLVPQEREIFRSLSVAENIRIALRPGYWTEASVTQLFPRLAERWSNMGSQLSGGEQQMLAIARALVGNPRVLLLDEPSEGLAPVVVEQVFAALQRIRDRGDMALILVEQHTDLALEFSQRVLVMDRGQIVHQGSCASLRADPDQLSRVIGIGT
jgi:branched-chain amino acid transport system ATP-binding protein